MLEGELELVSDDSDDSDDSDVVKLLALDDELRLDGVRELRLDKLVDDDDNDELMLETDELRLLELRLLTELDDSELVEDELTSQFTAVIVI